MTQAVLASWIRLDHWMRILIQDLGSTFLAYGRHLWHVDPNDPTFRSRTRNIFRDANVRFNVRVRRGGSLHASCFFFFYGSLSIYIYRMAFRRHFQWSTILDQSWIKLGSTWIKVIQMIQLLDQFLPFQYRLIHVWSKNSHHVMLVQLDQTWINSYYFSIDWSTFDPTVLTCWIVKLSLTAWPLFRVLRIMRLSRTRMNESFGFSLSS